MNEVKNYIERNKQKFLDELFSLIKIPSVSTKPGYEKDIRDCANQYVKLLQEAGVDKTKIFETAGNPIIFAEKIINKNLPTAIIYAHYDVQDVENQEWKVTKPFEPINKDGKIYARGADDDKGQGFMHVKAFEYMVKHDKLSCNVKFVIEGEEEITSPNFGKWCTENKSLLKGDFVMVSDTKMIDSDTPCIMTGLRGIVGWELIVEGPKQDVHSGHYGGAILNPLNVLCEIIAKLKDETGKITIPNFYDDVLELSEEERKSIQENPFDEKKLKGDLGIIDFQGEIGYKTIEHIGIRPSFDVLKLEGGSDRNCVHSIAKAKLSSRLVPNQNYKKIGESLQKYVEKIAPKNIKVTTNILNGDNPYSCSMDMSVYKVAENAFKSVYNKKPFPVKNGGSIGAITLLEESLNIKSLIIGFGLNEDHIHGEDESYPLKNFYNGIETIIMFYKFFNDYYKA
ncbi:MAG: M20/M25/M40 family metallo-hydrolase [Bacteroidales bacterium]|jgi:acetylornithine deacetylase/succinyl-diaminopimelate desuccinylase-like protein|nr:M20/M25/M40 family metallo-hydrolase [Bacteroidales bacterium]